MKRKLIPAAIAAALSLCGAAGVAAQDRVYRYDNDYSWRPARAADWNLAAADGSCHLRIWVDDRARIQLRGDQIIVHTDSGRRSFDQGSVCTQPLPFHRVDNFRVEVAQGRGNVSEVRSPDPGNNFAGAVTIYDPQPGGATYDLVMAWHNPAGIVVPPLAANDYPYRDDSRACQDRVRAEFLQRNRDIDAYLEFRGSPSREALGPARERIRGEAWARNRDEGRPIGYECVINDRDSRVLSARYDVLGRPRLSSLY